MIALLILAGWLLAVSDAAYGNAASPIVRSTSRLEVHTYKGRAECDELLSRDQGINTKTIVTFQAELMHKRRTDFTEAFIASRLKLAYQHWQNSIYFYTLKPNGIDPSSSLGLTFSDYREDWPAPSRLPEEDSLDKELERPYAKNGRGFIVEARTYGIAEGFRLEAFPVLFAEMLKAMEPRLRRLPREFRDEKIIHTYGGREAVIMYGAMGFEVIDEPPVMYDGKPLWRLRISPNELARQVERVSNLLQVGGFAQPLTFKSGSNSQPISVAAESQALFLNLDGNRRTLSHFSALETETEVAPGLWADRGSGGGIAGERVIFVNKLARPFKVNGTGVIAAKGSSIAFYPTGQLYVVGALAEDTPIGRAVAKKGSRVEYRTYGTVIFETAEDCIDPLGKVIPAGSRVLVEYFPGGDTDVWLNKYQWRDTYEMKVQLLKPFLREFVRLAPESSRPIKDVRDPIPKARFPGLGKLTEPMFEGFQFERAPSTPP